jgi:hypothetical protein
MSRATMVIIRPYYALTIGIKNLNTAAEGDVRVGAGEKDKD